MRQPTGNVADLERLLKQVALEFPDDGAAYKGGVLYPVVLDGFALNVGLSGTAR